MSVPLVGAFEVALGIGLLLGRFMPVFLAGVALQLSGTFLVPLLRPDVAFVDGNLLLLSVEVSTWSRTWCCWPRPPPWPSTRSVPDRMRPLLTVSQTPTTQPQHPNPGRGMTGGHANDQAPSRDDPIRSSAEELHDGRTRPISIPGPPRCPQRADHAR